MSNLEKPVFWTVAAIGLIWTLLYAGDLFSKSEQMPRIEYCKRLASYAVEMRRWHKEGAIVNVEPNMEEFKDAAIVFEGTDDELREQVMVDCLFVKT